MSQEEVLRMVASARDQATGPLRKVENALHALGKKGTEQTRQMRDNWRRVHAELDKVTRVAKTFTAPAFEAIGISSLSAVGAVAALSAGLKGFVDQGTDVAAFGNKVMLTTNTIRSLQGVAGEFQVDQGAIRQSLQGFSDSMYLIRRHKGLLYRHLFAQRPDVAQALAVTPETTAGNEKALQTWFKLFANVKTVHDQMVARMFSREAFGSDVPIDLMREGSAKLEKERQLYLQLSGNLNTNAGQQWTENWQHLQWAIEGVRNQVGNDLLPDMTKLAVQAKDFFAEHKVEIANDIVAVVCDLGKALRGVNTGVQAIGGWEVAFGGLIGLKLLGFAGNLIKVALGLRAITAAGVAFAASPLGKAGLLGAALYGLYETVKPQPAGESDAAERARRENTPEYRAWRDTHPAATALRPPVPPLAPAPSSSGAAGAAAIIQGLRNRGLDAVHTAILAGNIEQESNFNPAKPNVAEGGVGLIQWRLERRAALDRLAARRHTLEANAGTQLDFLMQELMNSPAGKAFLAAQTPEQMNRALHGFIRYGDNSEGKRLAYGRSLLAQSEKTQPGSLLAAANASGLGGPSSKLTGSASIDVNVTAPRGTSVKAAADGLFDSVSVNRGLAMPQASVD